MALRKKKPQQDDSEKLQALLKSWDIQFPETSEKDFPKSDFPEIKTDSPKPIVKLEKEIKSEPPKSEIKLEKETPKPARTIDFNSFFGKSEKKEPATLLTGNADLDKLFKQQIIQYLHGTVRMITLSNIMLSFSLSFLGICWMHGITAFLSIFCFLGAIIWIWYVFSWKLTFNGETNRFSYQSLFHEEIQFHASEIQNCKVERKVSKAMMDILYIKIYDRMIVINLGYVFKRGIKTENIGGYANSDKLKEYLDIYQDLHGIFNYSGFQAIGETPEAFESQNLQEILKYSRFKKTDKKQDSSSKQELMEMLAQYQKQIDEKKKLDKE